MVMAGCIYNKLEIVIWRHRKRHRALRTPLVWTVLHSSKVRQYNTNRPTEKMFKMVVKVMKSSKRIMGERVAGEELLKAQ